MNNRVVILVGAHKGENIQKYKTKYAPVYCLYAIEPVPISYACIEEAYHNDANVVLIKKAAWIEDGTKKMNLYASSSMSNSLYTRKKKIPEKIIDVETFDFSKFLAQFEKEQVRMLRMDIEGAEFAILAKCFEEGTMDRVKELHIEIHKPPRVSVDGSLVNKVLCYLDEERKKGRLKVVI